MKKTLAIILSAVMALSVCACGGGARPAETTAAAAETQAVEGADNQQSAWVEGVEVDEFGDVVADSENIILKTISIGDFSNTATSSSNLKVEIVLTPKKTNIFCFTLLEYGDTRATYSDNSKISMKVKIGEKKTEYKLMGKAPNGTLFLGINNNDSNDIFNALYYGDDVRCIIYIDNSQYNFTIPSNGFQELCKEEQKKIDAINEKYRIKDIASVVNNLLISKDGSAKLFEAYEYLEKNRDEFVLMTDDDIKNEIDGEFYYMTLSRPKNNSVILTYRYVVEYKDDTFNYLQYFKHGVDTIPEEYTHTSPFIYKDGVIKGGHQLRKMSDGYYVGYEALEGTPSLILMKGHQDSSGFTCDYQLPE